MSNITLTIPNDDHIALRAFGKALEEMALAHGAEPRKTVGELSYKLNIDTSEATAAAEEMQQVVPQMVNEPEIDTTPQQVESLAAPMGDDEEQAPPTIDSTGTPWDERIHSASKALNADGTWRLRRKPKDMDEVEWSDYVSMIKADLQYPVECGGEGEEIGEPTREEVDELIEASNKMLEPHVTPPGDDFHTDAGVVTEQTVVGIPPIPVPPPVVVAPPVPEVTEWDFPRLMTFLTERHGKIDVATVNTLLAQDGMSSVQELNAHPDKIGPFVARVKAHLGE
ncbi:hypothetical protein PQZ63_gp24 [Klebsiella phage pKp383]|uniref:hypothetical protein n=1 Tax=Klebsiella phage pKp383 TaxID=2961985 RepID=UPI0023306893|nr:hypothetical protein PQZ63_gp24 [Klebsiella phage pKp383]UVD41521.1 hypothetical protein [Klebsiella phage pKp383]